MAAYDNTHSRVVAWLKVVLPLVALAILSTLFLVSQRHEPTGSLPYTTARNSEALREQSMIGPNYAGVTTDGAAISLDAESARPGTGSTVVAQGLTGAIRTPDGGTLDLVAASADVDTAARSAELTGGVKIETSTGFTLDTKALTASLSETSVVTEGAVEGHGPMGRMSAGKMELRRETAEGQAPAYVLLFTDGVKLVYQPPANQGDRP
ncbi:LPS export ABC transporter periplasmic protein LptC [Oceaniglobus roseus]|uniref:LPS export ABC transporter periplasmic protein LptC n=1 Tax=Oceaniglobus roseus TaxID=1737570 RepID=UPI000C7F3241|nr:LPS export ABC transporter periplasmic protein LptC [Kandeliimicrobium roseum]